MKGSLEIMVALEDGNSCVMRFAAVPRVGERINVKLAQGEHLVEVHQVGHAVNGEDHDIILYVRSVQL